MKNELQASFNQEKRKLEDENRRLQANVQATKAEKDALLKK
eukprot:CAMPEP_0170475160 /NCGR_PEP_ID=MMETSP0123-20130129/16862_1 /TAXON_ID=182087 /ORGANISM="Favella ehrenbergii, Strain Fehren 1" /LENGTH=40 /DNA_ID= /DNA_START= /DNA_END= /DNA_ORIENTATION=